MGWDSKKSSLQYWQTLIIFYDGYRQEEAIEQMRTMRSSSLSRRQNGTVCDESGTHERIAMRRTAMPSGTHDCELGVVDETG